MTWHKKGAGAVSIHVAVPHVSVPKPSVTAKPASTPKPAKASTPKPAKTGVFAEKKPSFGGKHTPVKTGHVK